MVQRSADQEAGIVPQRTTYLLRAAANKRGANLYGAAADVPLRHQYDKSLCRPAEQDKGQGCQKTVVRFVATKQAARTGLCQRFLRISEIQEYLQIGLNICLLQNILYLCIENQTGPSI